MAAESNAKRKQVGPKVIHTLLYMDPRPAGTSDIQYPICNCPSRRHGDCIGPLRKDGQVLEGPLQISTGLGCRETVRMRFYASNDTSPMLFNSLAEHLNKNNIEYEGQVNWEATYNYFLEVISVRIIFICIGKHSNQLLS